MLNPGHYIYKGNMMTKETVWESNIDEMTNSNLSGIMKVPDCFMNDAKIKLTRILENCQDGLVDLCQIMVINKSPLTQLMYKYFDIALINRIQKACKIDLRIDMKFEKSANVDGLIINNVHTLEHTFNISYWFDMWLYAQILRKADFNVIYEPGKLLKVFYEKCKLSNIFKV